MLVSDAIALCEFLVEESYAAGAAAWLGWFNLALDDLTPIAKVRKSVGGIAVSPVGGYATINKADVNALGKAHDILSVEFTPAGGDAVPLRRLHSNDRVSRGWKETATAIVLQKIGSTAGTANIDYYEKLQPLTATTDDITAVSGIPAEYTNLVILYACAKSQQKEEELNDRNSFYAEYLVGRRTMALARLWEMEPHMRKAIAGARLAAAVNAKY